MYKITKAIEEVINGTKITGNSEIEINDSITIEALWESWDENESLDIITVYIYENGIIKFRYQVEETLTK